MVSWWQRWYFKMISSSQLLFHLYKFYWGILSRVKTLYWGKLYPFSSDGVSKLFRTRWWYISFNIQHFPPSHNVEVRQWRQAKNLRRPWRPENILLLKYHKNIIISNSFSWLRFSLFAAVANFSILCSAVRSNFVFYLPNH